MTTRLSSTPRPPPSQLHIEAHVTMHQTKRTGMKHPGSPNRAFGKPRKTLPKIPENHEKTHYNTKAPISANSATNPRPWTPVKHQTITTLYIGKPDREETSATATFFPTEPADLAAQAPLPWPDLSRPLRNLARSIGDGWLPQAGPDGM